MNALKSKVEYKVIDALFGIGPLLRDMPRTIKVLGERLNELGEENWQVCGVVVDTLVILSRGIVYDEEGEDESP